MTDRREFTIEGWDYSMLWNGPGFYGQTIRGGRIEIIKLAEFGASAIDLINEQRRRNCTRPVILQTPDDFCG